MSRRSGSSPLFDYVLTKAWALDQTVLNQLTQVVVRHAQGVRIDDQELEEILAKRESQGRDITPSFEIRDGTAIIPISGVIAKYSRQVNGSSQPRGTSTQEIAGQLREALATDSVHQIMLQIDSPGGAVDGVAELADEVFNARQSKPITAVADGMCCSAAYWIASQAHKVITTRGAAVGSIGVYAAIADTSRAAQNEGIDVAVVKAGRNKGAGVPGTPVTPEQLGGLQSVVDSIYELFVSAVARGRGMSEEQALALADGMVHIGQKAIELGLADSMGTMESSMPASRPSVATGADGMPVPEKGEKETDFVSRCMAHAETRKKFPEQQQRAAFCYSRFKESQKKAESSSDVPQPEAPTVREKKDMTNPPSPQAADADSSSVSAQHPRAAAELLAEGAITERKRSKAIRALSAQGQEDLCESLIDAGASEPEALRAFHMDLRNRQSTGLAAITAAAPKSAGNDDPRAAEKFTEQAQEPAEDDFLSQAKAAWKKDKGLAKSFDSVELYASYLQSLSANPRRRR